MIDPATLTALRQRVPEWTLVEPDGAPPRIVRTFRFDGYPPAVAFVNRIAEAAEAADHHPSIRLDWGAVEVTWWSHDTGGISERDLALAERTDALAAS